MRTRLLWECDHAQRAVWLALHLHVDHLLVALPDVLVLVPDQPLRSVQQEGARLGIGAVGHDTRAERWSAHPAPWWKGPAHVERHDDISKRECLVQEDVDVRRPQDVRVGIEKQCA